MLRWVQVQMKGSVSRLSSLFFNIANYASLLAMELKLSEESTFLKITIKLWCKWGFRRIACKALSSRVIYQIT